MISKIDGTGPIRAPQTVRRTSKARKTSSAGFSKHLGEADDVEGASAAQGTSPLGTVTGVLGIQEVDDALARAAKGKLRAQDILDKLDDLRLELLEGRLSRDKLVHLAKVVNARRVEVSDPRLAEVLDEIDLRAQVELAKFGR